MNLLKIRTFLALQHIINHLTLKKNSFGWSKNSSSSKQSKGLLLIHSFISKNNTINLFQFYFIKVLRQQTRWPTTER